MWAYIASIPFAAAMLCGLVSAHLFTAASGQRPWPNRLLGGFFGIFAVQLGLLSLQIISNDWSLGVYRIALMLLANPLIYFFFWTLRRPDTSPIKTLHGLHFLPATVVPVLVATHNEGLLDIVLSGSLLGYAAVFGWSLRGGSASFDAVGPNSGKAFRWLLTFALFFAFSAVIDLVIAFQIESGGAVESSTVLPVVVLGVLVAVAFVALGAMGHQSIFDWMREASTISVPTAGVEPEELEDLAVRVRAAIEDHKNYGDEELTITKFSRRLGVPARHVSLAVNRYLGCTFSQLVNRTRIAAAQSLICQSERDERSFLEIAYDVGFRSKSNFNKEFKKITGLTPSRFRMDCSTDSQ